MTERTGTRPLSIGELADVSRVYADHVRIGIVLSTHNLARHLDEVADALDDAVARLDPLLSPRSVRPGEKRSCPYDMHKTKCRDCGECQCWCSCETYIPAAVRPGRGGEVSDVARAWLGSAETAALIAERDRLREALERLASDTDFLPKFAVDVICAVLSAGGEPGEEA